METPWSEALFLPCTQGPISASWPVSCAPLPVWLSSLGPHSPHHPLFPSAQAPVFLLFLDCVWQLLQQFPAKFEFSEFFLLALHDSVRVPDTLTFLRDTPWERGKHSAQVSHSVFLSGMGALGHSQLFLQAGAP